jgi:two-component system, LytTR family, sensor kinase
MSAHASTAAPRPQIEEESARGSEWIANVESKSVRNWILLYWGIIALLFFARDVVASRVGMGDSLVAGIWAAAVSFLAFLVCMRLARGRRLVRYVDLLVLLLLAAVVAAGTLLLLNAVTCYPSSRSQCTASAQLATAIIFFPSHVAITLSFLAIGYAVTHARSYGEGEARRAVAEAELSRTQAAALACQLRPHFLFNTLQSVAVLIRHEPSTAVSMLRALQQLLERSSTVAVVPTVALREEFELLQLYLGIEAIRFQEQLEIAVSLDPRVEEALVPPFLLQPLVENAVRHAVLGRGTARLTVTAEPTADGSNLRIVVWDSGSGGSECQKGGMGVGLTNTRARLRNLFDGRFDLRLEVDGESGTSVTVVVPLA